MSARPTLSIVVTSNGDERALEDCLFAIVGQADAMEVVVADGSRADMAGWAAERFPDVRVAQFRDRRTVPAMRWAAAATVRGDVVAVTESRMVPAPGWCRAIVDAHGQWPDAPAIGGSVSLAPDPSARDRALYLCEYPAFIPPIAEGPVTHLTGANVSYKRTALESAHDLLGTGCWEPILHDRWMAEGRTLRACAFDVQLAGALPPRAAAAMRLHYGRQYAADRSAAWPLGRRLMYALAAPLLPVVLLARLRRALRGKPSGTWQWRALPWVVVFMALWATGEAIGYVAGRDRIDRLF